LLQQSETDILYNKEKTTSLLKNELTVPRSDGGFFLSILVKLSCKKEEDEKSEQQAKEEQEQRREHRGSSGCTCNMFLGVG
jgi:hypothetical protein